MPDVHSTRTGRHNPDAVRNGFPIPARDGIIASQLRPCAQTKREASFEVYKSGPNKGRRKPGKVVEHECSYVADFVYTQDGETVVEDVKGYRDPSSAAYAKFVIKRKLMLERYGIRVKEV